MTIPTAGVIAASCDRMAIKAGWRVERYGPRPARREISGLPDRRYAHDDRKQVLWVTFLSMSPASTLTALQHQWIVRSLAAKELAAPIDSPRGFERLLESLVTRDHALALEICKALLQFAETKKGAL